MIAPNLSLLLSMDIAEELNSSLDFHYCIAGIEFSLLPLESYLVFHKGKMLDQDRFHANSVFHRSLTNRDSWPRK